MRIQYVCITLLHWDISASLLVKKTNKLSALNVKKI